MGQQVCLLRVCRAVGIPYPTIDEAWDFPSQLAYFARHGGSLIPIEGGIEIELSVSTDFAATHVDFAEEAPVGTPTLEQVRREIDAPHSPIRPGWRYLFSMWFPRSRVGLPVSD